ncbi:MAG TPA: hypothetical protein VNG29_02675 [Candidatus Paceibacterota bacterium]|nr:hypothetical protein [Candidatus Paceibacterota bacterium]
MLKFIGRDIWRGGEKVGWVEENHIYAHDGKKLGYFEGNYVYDANSGQKIAYIEGDYLISEGGNQKIPLDKVSEEIVGGVLPEIGKCAVYVLLD